MLLFIIFCVDYLTSDQNVVFCREEREPSQTTYEKNGLTRSTLSTAESNRSALADDRRHGEIGPFLRC